MTSILKSVEQVAASYQHDTTHARQVAKLAGELFDSCPDLHGLSSSDRDLLIYAAVLHDIGWHFGQQKHHKNSYEMILKDPPRGLSPREIRVVANVARYHRKALPSSSHDGFALLRPADRELVRRLASVLRIADGLDVSHGSICKLGSCSISNDTVTISIVSDGDCRAGLEAAAEKSDLFEQTFGRKVKLEMAGAEKQ